MRIFFLRMMVLFFRLTEGYPAVFNRNKVALKDYSSPLVGQTYDFVEMDTQYGRWSDPIYTPGLLLMGPSPDASNVLPREPFCADFQVIEVLHQEDVEIVVLNNYVTIIVSKKYSGSSVGDIITVDILKRGVTAYFTAHSLGKIIPTNREGNYLFTAP